MVNNVNDPHEIRIEIDIDNLILNNNHNNNNKIKDIRKITLRYNETDTVKDVIEHALIESFRTFNNHYIRLYESLIDLNYYKMKNSDGRFVSVRFLHNINFIVYFRDKNICSIKYFPQSGAGIKEYIKLQKGGKRLLRYGKRGGKYYMKGGKRIYVKN